MGAQQGDRFRCECGAEITFTSACPHEATQNPECVCGKEFEPAS